MTEDKTTEKRDKVRLVKKSAVGWFNVRMLLNTAVQAVLTTATGNRTSRREVMAALDVDLESHDPHPAHDLTALRASPDQEDTVWVDYIADLGDGFDATHSVAWLVGRDRIGLGPIGKPTAQPMPPDCMTEAPVGAFAGNEHVLEAGKVTIFGGDLVYPYATKRNYAERTVGPYRAARPWQNGGRMLFSLPGNHDWYDGLASFVHRFCQRGRWMGAWQVQQKRSYFALRLGHGFSIWGIDLATANDFDAAQLEYFRAQAEALKDNEQVILCVPQPAWTERTEPPNAADAVDEDAWDTIRLLNGYITNNEKRALNPARVPVIIAGDAHHYVRHEIAADDNKLATHLITCGGGGAFMLGTDAVPEELHLGDMGTATRKTPFPSVKESKSMRLGVFNMVLRHAIFCATVSAVMLCLVWLTHAASKALIGSGALKTTALDAVPLGFADVVLTLLRTLIYTPPLLGVTGLVAAGFIGFAHGARAKKTPNGAAVFAGTVHFLAQFAIAFSSLLLTVIWLQSFEASPLTYVLLLPPVAVLLSWLACGLTFSLYIWLSNIAFKLHEQEIYSSQSIEDWKSFLRMRIGPDGLTIYPIGLRKIERNWQLSSGIQEVQPNTMMARAVTTLGVKAKIVEMREGTTNILRPVSALQPQLIEKEITVHKRETAV